MNIDNLNNCQREAVLYNSGPLLILAGAGSGKTRVLTTKIGYLIEDMNVSPYNILAITFTNKAAKEMKDRIHLLIGDISKSLQVSTFHSFGLRLLRENCNVLGYDNFIKEMNLKAIKLGMKNTTFENPHGLNDNSKNISTAEDMSKLMRYAIKNKEFLNITSSKIYKVDKYIWPNKNKLLKQYKYLISGKIGYTKASGQVFVSAAKKDGKTLIITSIDESDKFNLHKKLYEKYFEAYEKYKILDMNTFSFKVKNKNKYHYYIDNDYYMLLKKDEINKLKIKIDLSKNEEKVTIILNNKIIDNVKLKKIKYEVKTNKIKQILSFWK